MRTTTTRPASGGVRAPAPSRTTGPVPQPRGGLVAPRHARSPAARRGLFHLPDGGNPVPHPIRLFVICTWVAALGLIGLPVAVRSSLAIIAGGTPGWFEPAVVAAGLLGIVATAAAFTALHRRWLPWFMLLMGTGSLAGTVLLTLTL